tara:strand:+ start:68 stop:814 length:747 start_codon:yes stop_codon:yes gene_type:complete
MKEEIKKIITSLVTKLQISRIIYLIFRAVKFIIPSEIKPKSKLELKLEDDLAEETYKHFKEHFKKSVIFKDVVKIREYAITTSLSNDKKEEYYYLEFGVFKGESANYFSKFVNKFYCFDGFEGLKEDWVGTGAPRGAFNLNKKIPRLNSNVTPIVGWVEDTLDNFLKEHNPKINFIHLDMDTYKSTKFTLEKLKPYLVKNAIILFDELYNYVGWENGEYKALNEVFKENEFEYKAFTIHTDKAAIQIK